MDVHCPELPDGLLHSLQRRGLAGGARTKWIAPPIFSFCRNGHGLPDLGRKLTLAHGTVDYVKLPVVRPVREGLGSKHEAHARRTSHHPRVAALGGIEACAGMLSLVGKLANDLVLCLELLDEPTAEMRALGPQSGR